MKTKTTTTVDEFQAPGSERLIGFSDAVFAIIITLLVLEIKRPEVEPGELGHALLGAWPFYLAYLLSFLYVGVVWMNHHALFQRVLRVTPTLKWINLGILGTTALLPFPMGVLAVAFHSGSLADQRAAVVLYAAIAGLMSAAWLPTFPYLHRNRQLAHPRVPPIEFRAQISRPVIGIMAYAVAAVLGWFVSPLIALIIFAAMVAYHAVTSQGLPPKASI